MKSLSQVFYSLFVLVLLFIVGYLAIHLYNRQETMSSFAILTDPEHEYPTRYLSTTGNYQRTFWGDKVNIKGSVANTAGHTNYKDVVLQVSFYSNTRSVIEAKNYVLYDYFTYGSTKEFKLKLPYPKEAVSCGWEVVKATYY